MDCRKKTNCGVKRIGNHINSNIRRKPRSAHEIKKQSSQPAQISCHRHTNGKCDYNPFYRLSMRACKKNKCERMSKRLSVHHDGIYIYIYARFVINT